MPAHELEKFVVDEIKAISKDPRLVGEGVKRATKGLGEKMRELEKELERLEKERKRLEKERKRLERERGNLVGAMAEGDKAPGTSLLELLCRVEAVQAEQAALEAQVIGEDDPLSFPALPAL